MTEDHVCCNLERLENQQKLIDVYKKCLTEINDYIKSLDTEDKRTINNIIINTIS